MYGESNEPQHYLQIDIYPIHVHVIHYGIDSFQRIYNVSDMFVLLLFFCSSIIYLFVGQMHSLNDMLFISNLSVVYSKQGRIQDFFSGSSTRSISIVRTRTQSTNQSPINWKSIILALLKHTGYLKLLKSQTTEHSVLILSNLSN